MHSFILIVLLGACSIQAILSPAQGADFQKEQPFVTVEIRYHMPDAGDVFLVWGINGWKLVSLETRPPGTEVKDRIMYTPMIRGGDNVFVAEIRAPSGATIDYAFQITKTRGGESVNLWDTNGAPKRDFHTVAVPDGVAEVQTTLTLSQSEGSPKKIFIGRHPVIWILLVIGFVFWQVLHRHSRIPIIATLKILCTGAILFIFLLIARAKILGFDLNPLLSSGLDILKLGLAGYYDFCYVGFISLIFFGFCLLSRNSQKVNNRIFFVFLSVAVFSLIVGFLNIRIVKILGRPFNYQWLYYSDFLKSTDAKIAILSNVSWELLVYLAEFVIALVIASLLLSRAINFLLTRYNVRVFLSIAVIAALVIYFPLANWYLNKRHLEYSKLENPIVSFLQSTIFSHMTPKLYTMKTPIGPTDFQPFENRPLEISSLKAAKNSKINNIILYVLESIPAEYVFVTSNAEFEITPELKRFLKQSAVFKNIYAHAPATNKSLVSILCSIYPWISYMGLTQKYPDINIVSLSMILKRHGYRTAYFNSGDNRFNSADRFLSYQDFDRVEDYRTLKCNHQGFTVEFDEWNNLDGTVDECVVDSFIDWAGADLKKSFFAVLWTYQTHYPYFVSGEKIDFGVNSDKFNQYLNAVHDIDKSLGKLMRWLENHSLLERSLIVVVGDHGEAFGRHGQYVHASHIYEENVHVPLIFINSRLFKGEEYPTIGGLIDVAPTILDILSFPLSSEWQGRSLFSNPRSGRVYFFSPWSDYLYGYREDNHKIIFNASRNKYEIYDLKNDPKETDNLAEQLPNFKNEGIQRLASWVQFQDKFLREFIEGERKP